jgi:hypothetical protein
LTGADRNYFIGFSGIAWLQFNFDFIYLFEPFALKDEYAIMLRDKEGT